MIGSGLFRPFSFPAVQGRELYRSRANEFVGIVGESGSGKTTLARLLCGLESPSAGAITLAGRRSCTVRRGRACISADMRRWCSRTRNRRSIRAGVSPALSPSRWKRPAAAAASERLARARSCWRRSACRRGRAALSRRSSPAASASGSISRARSARRRKLLIADEIVSGLDVSVQAQLLNLLMRLREQPHFLDAVYLARSLGGSLSVRSGAGHAVAAKSSKAARPAGIRRASASLHATLLAAVPPDDPSTVWNPKAAEAEAATLSGRAT